MNYLLDVNFILDAITDRSENKRICFLVLEDCIKNGNAYISSSSVHNLRFIIKKHYGKFFDKYLILEKTLKIAKTPSYIDFDEELAKKDIEDYLLELSAESIDAKIITNDKLFLEHSKRAISPIDYILENLGSNKKPNIDFANLKKQYFLYYNEFEKELDKVLNSARYIMGPQIEELENNLCEFTGAKHAIACGSGTDALLLTLMAIDIKPGDEIITTPFTFIATAETIALLGAKPVFVDIDEKTYNIDVNKIEEKITDKTKAIIAVSLFGQPCDLDELNSLIHPSTHQPVNSSTHHPIYLIVDGAQSFGATYKGKAEVHYCDIYTTSFFPAKPLGCFGDGGAVLTNNDELAEKIKMLRIHGQNEKYHHKYIGLNARMDTLQAAVLNVKLKHYKEDLQKRQQVAEKYNKLLVTVNSDSGKESADTSHYKLSLVLPKVKPDRTSVWAQYSVRVVSDSENKVTVNSESENIRDRLIKKLSNNTHNHTHSHTKIPTAIHYPMPLHLQECFEYLGYKKGNFPVAEKVSKEILSLPMNPYLANEEIKYIVDKIIKTLNNIHMEEQ